jgi:putative transposase
MRRLDELFMAHPFYGSRQMVRHLRREGVRVGRHRVRRLMRLMGLEAIYQAPRTSRRHPAHRVYPYLLKGVAIERPGHVWSADITYIPVQKGFLYLVAVMDWATRRVLSWRLSNTLDTRFCTDALTEALERYGCPEIFNTDQGSQFTSQEFTSVLNESGVAISMDGRGRCMDNIFIERLWRSLKYEAVYLHELSDGFRAQKVISRWVAFYNSRRPHSALGGATPAEAYDRGLPAESQKKTVGSSPSLPAPLQHQDEVNKNLAA